MAAMVSGLPTVEVLPAVVSDADVLATTASLLAAVPGRTCETPLSQLLGYVYATCCPGCSGTAERAERIELGLAAYLRDRRVLRVRQVSVLGVDVWAAATPVVFLRVALLAYARRLRLAGDPR